MRDKKQKSFGIFLIDAIEYKTRLNCPCSEPQRVILFTAEELEYALDYLKVSAKDQLKLFKHELSHFTQAKTNDLQARFCLTFYRTETGGLAIIPGTQIHATLNNSLDDTQRRRGLKAAIGAPEDLSSTDKRLLL
jgi:hypothetical protein